jgi:predicted nucleic acid-binding protein
VIVLDASAAVDVLLRIEPQASAITERFLEPGESLHAPALIHAEAMQALRRKLQKKALSPTRAREAVDDLTDLRLIRYPLPPLLDRMWELRDNLSAYDAAYVALAEALDAPLVTCDTKLAGTPGHRARVETYP